MASMAYPPHLAMLGVNVDRSLGKPGVIIDENLSGALHL